MRFINFYQENSGSSHIWSFSVTEKESFIGIQNIIVEKYCTFLTLFYSLIDVLLIINRHGKYGPIYCTSLDFYINKLSGRSRSIQNIIRCLLLLDHCCEVFGNYMEWKEELAGVNVVHVIITVQIFVGKC